MERDKSLRILIVEDETVIRTSFAMMVEDMGHQVVGEAANGVQALEMVDACSPELILLDVNLPEINGLKVLETIQANYDIPCIIITGYYSHEFLDRAKKAGAFGYLIKPIEERQLQAGIEVTWQRYLEYQNSVAEQKRLRVALEERKIIERAKGVLMRCKGLSEEEAMRALQKMSRDNNQKIAKVARLIINADKILRD